jgi:cytochrome c553
MKMKNISTVLMAIIIVITAFAATIPNAPTPPKFKNLKVLPKNISEAALDKIMDDYNFALGVKCNFCHAKDLLKDELNFASDAKAEKNMTRKMIVMTNEINVKNFSATKDKLQTYMVTCITCHRQQAYPTLDSLKAK